MIQGKGQTVKRGILMAAIINLFLLACGLWYFHNDRYTMMITPEFDYDNLTEYQEKNGSEGEYKASIRKLLFPVLNSGRYQLEMKYYTPGGGELR